MNRTALRETTMNEGEDQVTDLKPVYVRRFTDKDLVTKKYPSSTGVQPKAKKEFKSTKTKIHLTDWQKTMVFVELVRALQEHDPVASKRAMIKLMEIARGSWVANTGATLFKEWSLYREASLEYKKADSWDRMLHQGIHLLERFVQADRVLIRNRSKISRLKSSKPWRAATDLLRI
jgi:hypothetical protein